MSSLLNIIISEKEFNEMYSNKVGTLMFPDELWDCISYVDYKKLREGFKNDLPKGAKIKMVLVYNRFSKHYKNIKNTKIPYAYPVFCDEEHDGAFKDNELKMWLCNYPVGNTIIVINK